MRSQMLIENGIEIALIVDMNAQPVECGMCGAEGFHDHCVPWYCGPVLEGESEGGYRTVCKLCHNKWEDWANQSVQPTETTGG